MSRRIKDMIIRDIESRIADTADFIAVDCSRLDALSTNRWRLGLQELNISVLTGKNSLIRHALGKKGVKGLDSVLAGPTTLVWGSEDVVALSRSIVKWADELGPLEIKGASVEGESLDAEAVEALSKSSGRLETIGELAGLMMAPGRQLAGAMQSCGGMLAGQFQTISEKEES
jgi:large subunit ribosomal protein L10